MIKDYLEKGYRLSAHISELHDWISESLLLVVAIDGYAMQQTIGVGS